MKIHKGDKVVIITGKDKGKSGTVFRTLPKAESVVIEGMNIAKRHQKARGQGSTGQIVERPMPIHISNVALVEGGKAGRVGYRFEGEGDTRKKVREVRGGKRTVK